MKEHYVSFECAKRLKALGFRWKVDRCYTYWYESEDPEDDTMTATLHRSGLHDHNGIFNNPISEDGIHYSAPRLDRAAAWLREVKGIFVGVTYDNNMSNYNPYGFRVQIPMCNDRSALGFHEYNQALSAGIDKALELLGKEVNNA